MAKNIQGGRFILKRSIVKGETPTIPPNNDHTQGWINTDIYQAELFLNIYDNKMWFRSYNDKIVQLVELSPNGTIDPKYLPNHTGMVYCGVWDSTSNIAPSNNPSKGDYYIVNNSGITEFISDEWCVGDYIIFDGIKWDKISNTITASKVEYKHESFTNLNDVLNSLLDKRFYKSGTNIIITNDNKISLGDNISISGKYIGDEIYIKNQANISSLIVKDVSANGVYSSDISSTAISIPKGRINAKELQTTALYFNTTSNKITHESNGLNIYLSGDKKLETGSKITTSYNIIRYNESKVFDSVLDLVNKGYLDNNCVQKITGEILKGELSEKGHVILSNVEVGSMWQINGIVYTSNEPAYLNTTVMVHTSKDGVSIVETNTDSNNMSVTITNGDIILEVSGVGHVKWVAVKLN